MMIYDGDFFDMIIDDLYFEQDGELQWVIEVDVSWFDVLIEYLIENGLLVMNFVNYKEWRYSVYYNEDFVVQEF